MDGTRVTLVIAGMALAAALSLDNALATPPESSGASQERVVELLRARDHAALREIGPGVMETLVRLYPTADESTRAQIAGAFYFLGWKSENAKRVMLADIRTPHEDLRLGVQWALGRVSDSPEVVEILLENMMQDPNPLFRDKAAYALAHDQIHLSEEQKVQLFAGLIYALDDPKPQVRAIALQALQIQTGQTRGYSPAASKAERVEPIRSWRAWLDEYRTHL